MLPTRAICLLAICLMVAATCVMVSGDVTPIKPGPKTAHMTWGDANAWAVYLPTTTTTTTTTATTIAPEPVTEPPVTNNHESESPPIGGRSGGGGAGGELASIRSCESGGNYSYNDGAFQGAYNFTPETWRSAGGSTSTADQASPFEQDAVAAAYIAAGNRGAWPNC